MASIEFDTETSRIANFEKRLQLPGFSPVRDLYLIAIVMLLCFRALIDKNQVRLSLTVRVEYFSVLILKLKLKLSLLSLFQTACHCFRN